jgi:glycosyltransferase involved in cell wall biosynthesis
MRKVYVNSPNEGWIVDRFVDEWYRDNADISTNDPTNADVIWLLSDWTWNRFPLKLLRDKKVITTVHHIVPEKFDSAAKDDFFRRDEITDVYHVFNERALQQVRFLSKKNVELIPYWANQRIWHRTTDSNFLRAKYGIPINSYACGSFQRDTEGSDLKSPKLEKGPDLLADALIKFKSWNVNLHVVLAGWRRQYIMRRLDDAGINFTYVERPNQEIVNELYQTLSLYPVTARHEGGPQSLIECGLLEVPVVSRPVGIAEQVLPLSSISDDITLAKPAVPNVKHMLLPEGYKPYRALIESVEF